MLGWIFGGLVKKFERAARDVSQDFVESSGREIDRLFNEKLDPLADKLDYIVEKRIKESKAEIEELEVKFKTDIEFLLNNADEKVRENLETVDLVRQEALRDARETIGLTDAYLENRINQMSLAVMEALAFTQVGVDRAFAKVEILENQLFQDANYLVDKLINAVDEIIEGKIEKVSMTLKKYLDHPLPGPFDKCKQRLNIHWKFGSQISDIELYRLAECYELTKLNENTPIDKVLEIYGQLQLNAARMAALVRNAPALKRIAVEDWIKYGVLCEFWYDTMKSYDSNLPMLMPEMSAKLLISEDNNNI